MFSPSHSTWISHKLIGSQVLFIYLVIYYFGWKRGTFVCDNHPWPTLSTTLPYRAYTNYIIICLDLQLCCERNDFKITHLKISMIYIWIFRPTNFISPFLVTELPPQSGQVLIVDVLSPSINELRFLVLRLIHIVVMLKYLVIHFGGESRCRNWGSWHNWALLPYCIRIYSSYIQPKIPK